MGQVKSLAAYRYAKRTRTHKMVWIHTQSFFVFAKKEKLKGLCSLHVRNCLIAWASGSLKTEKFTPRIAADCESLPELADVPKHAPSRNHGHRPP